MCLQSLSSTLFHIQLKKTKTLAATPQSSFKKEFIKKMRVRGKLLRNHQKVTIQRAPDTINIIKNPQVQSWKLFSFPVTLPSPTAILPVIQHQNHSGWKFSTWGLPVLPGPQPMSPAKVVSPSETQSVPALWQKALTGGHPSLLYGECPGFTCILPKTRGLSRLISLR